MGKHWVEGEGMSDENMIDALRFVSALTFMASGTGFHFGCDEDEVITVLGNDDGGNHDFIRLLLQVTEGLNEEEHAESVMFSCFVEIVERMMESRGPRFSKILLEAIKNLEKAKRENTYKN